MKICELPGTQHKANEYISPGGVLKLDLCILAKLLEWTLVSFLVLMLHHDMQLLHFYL